ncbi:nitrate ABC transporter substrate-binding protein [Nocardia mexicana]|uniref:ABC-type nitrate/sulfonate/bicarbonate transport system substrate-binding protein n=1 Tax=Nocardia mexicana TaxID=279262 RepID=A0A370HFI8_9NOCA|nr:nitrate ABC transporter substrate-binding protein [Nocardia mexicana]RDI56007.1 ABC-type nitrate/sulfonate/bicarbonate transport system substrate-binding protein [Nocardia mexicana]
MRNTYRPVRSVLGAAILGLAALTGCADSGGTAATSGYSGPIGSVDLQQVCPAKIVVQTDWNPEAEHGGLYQMLGPDPVFDAGGKKVTGPLFAHGEYTGVDVEIRAGGPAIGFQSVTSQMYQDDSIMLGLVDTDQAVQSASTNPTTAVVAPLRINPQMIMWDPATYPNVRTIADLKAARATVLYFEGAAYMDYLTGAGILDKGQVDGSYDGTPANFVAAGGAKAQQGFSSSEPYLYQQQLAEWHKPIAYQLVHDAGFPLYKSTLAVRSGQLEDRSACLQRLVPVLQRAQVDYFADPARANDVIVQAVEKYSTGWVYDAGNAAFAAKQMRDSGIVGNEGATVGATDPARVQRIIDLTRPIYSAQKVTVPQGLTPEQIATNRFVDPTIGYPS